MGAPTPVVIDTKDAQVVTAGLWERPNDLLYIPSQPARTGCRSDESVQPQVLPARAPRITQVVISSSETLLADHATAPQTIVQPAHPIAGASIVRIRIQPQTDRGSPNR